ncbi:phosphopantothenoylcysteine decarboxylase, partial [Streptococcus suis]
QALKRGREVTLVTTRQAFKPDSQKNLTIIEITNVDSLKETLEHLVKTHQALINSMAVSDYTHVYMAGLDELRSNEY